MATPSLKIIDALRNTANQLENGNRYEWGHMGSCNCGNLAQTITTFTRAEIQKYENHITIMTYLISASTLRLGLLTHKVSEHFHSLS